jgi:hypothetical protein
MEEVVSGPQAVLRVMPVVSLISSDEEQRQEARDRLAGILGTVETSSVLYPFDLSDYYSPEMGGNLTRLWLAFGDLRDPSELADWKIGCCDIENDLLDSEGNRIVNIDPGYIDFGKLVLASFKEAPDKIYMGRGVWAHTCLRYGHGEFTAPDHSFPDFKDGRFDGFMLEARRRYRTLLRSSG